jgi:hypothetical protein
MTLQDINKAMGRLRAEYPMYYYRELVGKRFQSKFISHELEKIFEEKGFKTYAEIKKACPKGMELSHFIKKLVG